MHSETDEEMTERVHGKDEKALPLYKCHKVVGALKVKEILPGENGQVMVVPEEEGYDNFLVTAEWAARHKPQVGGYYVVYDDGYASWSPAEPFEEGYTSLKLQLAAMNYSKGWDELEQVEQIERLRYVLKSMQRAFGSIDGTVARLKDQFESHTHATDGSPVVKVRNSYGGGMDGLGKVAGTISGKEFI